MSTSNSWTPEKGKFQALKSAFGFSASSAQTWAHTKNDEKPALSETSNGLSYLGRVLRQNFYVSAAKTVGAWDGNLAQHEKKIQKQIPHGAKIPTAADMQDLYKMAGMRGVQDKVFEDGYYQIADKDGNLTSKDGRLNVFRVQDGKTFPGLLEPTKDEVKIIGAQFKPR